MAILIPSPPHYSDRVRAAFAEVMPEIRLLQIPMIESVIPEDNPLLRHLADHIEEYDFVVFSSRMAIDSFKKEWQRKETNCIFLAMGKDQEYMTQELGVRVRLTPDEPSPMGIVRLLSKEKDIKEKKIAVLSPAFEGVEEPTTIPDMLTELGELGMDVHRINAYNTQATSEKRHEEAYEQISSGEISHIAFTSAGEILSMKSRYKGDFGELTKDVTIACFGPYTAQRAKQYGVRVDIVPEKYQSFRDYAKAIEKDTKKYCCPPN